MRPKHVVHNRFFVGYRNGYCISHPIGINTMGKVLKLIGKFLNLPDREQSTGACSRRSSASQLANCEGDLITIMEIFGNSQRLYRIID